MDHQLISNYTRIKVFVIPGLASLDFAQLVTAKQAGHAV